MLRHAVDPCNGGRHRWMCALSAVVGLAAFLPAAEAADAARIGVAAYLREGPGTNYRPIDEAAAGREAAIVACAAEWCRIRLGDLEGYVPQAVLSVAAAPGPDAATQTCFVNQQAGYHGTRDVRLCHAASEGK